MLKYPYEKTPCFCYQQPYRLKLKPLIQATDALEKGNLKHPLAGQITYSIFVCGMHLLAVWQHLSLCHRGEFQLHFKHPHLMAGSLAARAP
ncbi:hypothetical protein [Helicobacter heilmannii]|uniref:hypothetical protein n=1 Tax=Helicobacter heilmannii TaxID=35817 RepID=UPI0006A1DD73|nr:hypothetical protein [Helicobacter heilmannii]CRF46148.1 hypothetical protein HHE014_11400 [Helicobacter heilmannii]CRF51679.1 hypothetical protein HHE06_15720 [Helicobacter heilmannii]